MSNHSINLQLPFPHTLRGMIERDGKKVVAIQSLGYTPAPYATYRVYDDGVCEHGHYFVTEKEMFQDLHERTTPENELTYRR